VVGGNPPETSRDIDAARAHRDRSLRYRPNYCLHLQGQADRLKQVGRELGVRYALEGSVHHKLGIGQVLRQREGVDREDDNVFAPMHNQMIPGRLDPRREASVVRYKPAPRLCWRHWK